MKRIAILGSTGSIGQSTLSIVEQFPERYAVAALAAGRNVDEALAQAARWRPKLVSLATEELAGELKERLKGAGITGIEVVHGTKGTVACSTHPDADFVVSAIVGVAGLEATHAAILAGKPVGLANKECMVAAGEILTRAARERNVPILPIDSEHNAVHQCMRVGKHNEVKTIWLTASGGPFRQTPLEQFAGITPEQALKHPTWVMGRRITIDSATMLNKGLEVIEACRLFDVPPSKVRVTVHPQSTVHSLVEYVDGSILAQISVTDMRLPILYALAYPERPASNLTFDLGALRHLEFEEPDFERFPCLRLAFEAAAKGGAHCIALNAADEVAVEAFLAGRISFTGIPDTIERVLASTPEAHPETIAGVLEADRDARQRADAMVNQGGRRQRNYLEFMQDFHTVVVAIIAFIILIGVMVVVHEFGHFAVAKLCGVRVESFSVGFGPRLFGIKHGDTDYKVCLLPLGGYVKMTGETPEQNLQAPGKPVMQQMVESGTRGAATYGDVAEDPGSFTAHARWQRMLIGLAGPVANFVLAFVLMLFYYHWFNEVPKYVVNSTTVEWVVPGSAAAQAGFQPGDVITRFDGAANPDWMQVGNRAQMNLNQTVEVTVERAGKPVDLSLHIPPLPRGEDELDFSDAGILPQFMPGPIGVHDVQPGTPAERAGLQAGDQIESVDGHQFHTVSTLLAYMQANPGKDLTLDVERKGHEVILHAQPTQWDSTWKLGFQAVSSPVRNDPLPMHKAVAEARDFCTGNSTLIVEVLGRLFTRKVAVSQLSGPVGIARMAGQAAEMNGWLPKFGLAAAISINLGILNLLPFPILDGGLILLLLIESVLRHDISINVKERIYQAAFVVLVVFFAFIIFNDVTKLPPFTHVRP